MSIKQYLVTLVTCLGLIQVHESAAMLAQISRLATKLAHYSYAKSRQQEEILPKQKNSEESKLDRIFTKKEIDESMLPLAENDPKISSGLKQVLEEVRLKKTSTTISKIKNKPPRKTSSKGLIYKILDYAYVKTRQIEISETEVLDRKEADVPESIVAIAENDPKISLLELFFEKFWPKKTVSNTPIAMENTSGEAKTQVKKKSFFTALFSTPMIEYKGESLAGREVTLNEHSNLMQFYVANQFAYNGGSYASCGYHALKNSLFVIIRALHAIHDDATLQETLNNFSKIKTLFGPLEKDDVGTWRAIIMQLRAERAFKNYIYHNLGLKELNAINESTTIQIEGKVYTFKKSKIHARYGTLIDNFALQAARALTQGEVTNVIIIPENVIEFIRNEVNKEGFITNPDDFFEGPLENFEGKPDYICEDLMHLFKLLADYLTGNDTLGKYFDIGSIKEFELNLDASPGVFKYYNDNNQSPLNSDGDWLQVEEIAMLHTFEQAKSPDLHQEKRAGLVHNLNHGFTIIEDINDLTNTHGGNIDPATYAEIMRDMEDPLKEARDALNDETIADYYHIFIICTAGRAGASHGHWFALILYKHDNKHDYIVMDSANNSSRLSDERVNTIISLLENQNVAQVKATPEELSTMEQDIRKNIINNDAPQALELIENYKRMGGQEDFTSEIQSIL